MIPNLRLVLVLAHIDEFGVSESRACVVVSQHRSTQRNWLVRNPVDMDLRQRVRALAVKLMCQGTLILNVQIFPSDFKLSRKG